MNDSSKTRIAHLAGPTATIQNTPPLVTSNKARAKHGLPLLHRMPTARRCVTTRCGRSGSRRRSRSTSSSSPPIRSKPTPPSSTGRPTATSAPTARSARSARTPSDKPVYEIELKPEDGLYPLPYMAIQADGSAWEEECAAPGAPTAARAFSPTARAASRRSTACRSAPNGTASLSRRSRRSTSTAACRPAATPRGCRRIAHRQGRGDIPPEVRGTTSSATSPITSPSRRRGRRSRRSPTTCRRSCRAASMTA